ncbi:MAG: hypothetical protein LBQ93_01430 [Treponema sp.]|jgi:hypothetical protein|nr:hypothetical protein [Treponema sp.]
MKKIMFVFLVFLLPIGIYAQNSSFVPEVIDWGELSRNSPSPNGYYYQRINESAIQMRAIEFLEEDLNSRYNKGLDDLFPSLRAWLGIDTELAMAIVPEDPLSQSRTDTSKKISFLQLWNIVKRNVPEPHRLMMFSLVIQKCPNLNYTNNGLFNYLELYQYRANLDLTLQRAYQDRYLPAYNRFDDNINYFWLVPSVFLIAAQDNVDLIISTGYWPGTVKEAGSRARIRSLFLEQILRLEGVL